MDVARAQSRDANARSSSAAPAKKSHRKWKVDADAGAVARGAAAVFRAAGFPSLSLSRAEAEDDLRSAQEGEEEARGGVDRGEGEAQEGSALERLLEEPHEARLDVAQGEGGEQGPQERAAPLREEGRDGVQEADEEEEEAVAHGVEHALAEERVVGRGVRARPRAGRGRGRRRELESHAGRPGRARAAVVEPVVHPAEVRAEPAPDVAPGRGRRRGTRAARRGGRRMRAFQGPPQIRRLRVQHRIPGGDRREHGALGAATRRRARTERHRARKRARAPGRLARTEGFASFKVTNAGRNRDPKK